MMVAVVASVIIQFVSFTGAGCANSATEAGFFIDRWSESLGRGDIPYEKLRGRDIPRKAFNLPLDEVPAAGSDYAMYFRVFAQHSAHSADQYESEFHLTREWVDSLAAGEVRTKTLKMNAVYEPQKGRKCELVVKLVKI